MGEVTVEDRGRITIPKELRDKLGIRSGEKMEVQEKNGELTIKPKKGLKELKQLKGCVKESDVNPETVKNMWDF